MCIPYNNLYINSNKITKIQTGGFYKKQKGGDKSIKETTIKIGTFMLSVLCKEYGVPFYSAAPISTIDFEIENGSEIPIEERDPEEVTHIGGVQRAPKEIAVFNPAFDVTPHQNITGIITEKGIIRPPYKQSIAKLRN